MAEDFDVWSNRQKERRDFEKWSNERKNATQPVKLSATPKIGFNNIGAQMGIIPTTQEVVEKGYTSPNKTVSAPAQQNITGKSNSYIPRGQALRQGNEPTPTKSFTFSQSPKANIPTNRFSGKGGTALPGF